MHIECYSPVDKNLQKIAFRISCLGQALTFQLLCFECDQRFVVSERYGKVINFWDDVYGFSMKCMKNEVLKEAFVETVPNEKIVTNPVVIKEIDLKTCNVSACIFSSKFSFKATKDCILTAIAGYFDAFFELDCKIEFSTGPHAAKTHWQQTLFFLGDTIDLKQGKFIVFLLIIL